MADAITFVRTDEQQMLASTLRELVESSTDLDRTRDQSLTTEAFDAAVWDGLVAMGLLGLGVPEDVGGLGTSFTEVGIAFEELGRSVVPVPLLSHLLATTIVDGLGDDAQRRRYLGAWIDGSTLGTAALFEGTHGDALDTLDTTATRTDSGWHIAGRKRYVTDATSADAFVVIAKLDGEPRGFVVPADAVDVVATPALDATRSLGDVVLDVVVDDGALLAESGVRDAVGRALDRGAVALAHEQLGGAQRCLELSVEYAATRHQFGRAIGSFQAVKHMCADMLVAVEHARSVAWHAAATLDDPEESAISVPLARSVCSDAYVDVAAATIQVHGGIGFTWEHDAHLYFKRAKADTLLLRSIDEERDRLASALDLI